MIRVRSEIVSPVINDFIRACVRTYTDDGSKTIFFPITGECLLSLSLLISNRSHGLENLDLDLSPLDPILISCVSPPSPLAHPLGLVRHLLLVAHVRRVDHDNYDDDDDDEEIPPSGSVINIFFYTIEYSAGVG